MKRNIYCWIQVIWANLEISLKVSCIPLEMPHWVWRQAKRGSSFGWYLLQASSGIPGALCMYTSHTENLCPSGRQFEARQDVLKWPWTPTRTISHSLLCQSHLSLTCYLRSLPSPWQETSISTSPERESSYPFQESILEEHLSFSDVADSDCQWNLPDQQRFGS